MSKYPDSHFRPHSPHTELFSPKSNQPDQIFDDALRSSHFFKKPDIIPYPFINFDQPSIDLASTSDAKYKDLLSQLEKEKSLRISSESTTEKLKEKLLYFQDLEKKYEEYRLKSLKISDLTIEIENLRKRVSILLEENEDLKKRLRQKFDQDVGQSKWRVEFEREEQRNKELLRELKVAEEAFEDLRILYAKDVGSQKERYEGVYQEKMMLEGRLREITARFEVGTRGDEDVMQERIRRMKAEYRGKVKDLEEKLKPDDKDDLSDKRLKEIESRLATLQGKLLEQSAHNEKALARRAPGLRKESAEREMSPYSTWKTLNIDQSPTRRVLTERTRSPTRQSPRRNLNEVHKNPSKTLTKSLKNSGFSSNSPSRVYLGRSSKSPTRSIPSSPTERSSSRNRLNTQRKQCDICIRKHGQDWVR